LFILYKYNLGLQFQDLVESQPDNIALEFDGFNKISYSELNRISNQLARYLIHSGVKKNDVICISGIKTIETYALIIACLKIGAIYVFIDSDSPLERLSRIIKTCAPVLIIVESDLIKSLENLIVEVKVLDIGFDLRQELSKHDKENLSATNYINSNEPAYIMFTSGSTGFPKGVTVTHNNVQNLISWSIDNFGISNKDKITNINPLYFDNSVFDVYSALFSGATLVPFTKSEVSDPVALLKKVNELGCTSWFSVPSLLIYLDKLKMLIPQNMTKIDRFIFGGEGYPKSNLKNLYDTYSDRARLYNVYGPTECTCICSSYEITLNDFDSLKGLAPLGEIALNFSFLILNDDLELVDDNDTGELCLLGPNVGLGYYNDKLRTNDSFVQNSLNSNYKDVMYKTGDLVRYDSNDKKIYFIGRKDNQIKHMGYRIELDEIEHALNQIESISESAVIHTLVNDISQIVAFISFTIESSSLDGNEIKELLKQKIPGYMIPSKIYFFDSLPKTSNGKINRKEIFSIYLGQS
jgi:D-alanine--poly(phosphoribitol) ligase subunit 1